MFFLKSLKCSNMITNQIKSMDRNALFERIRTLQERIERRQDIRSSSVDRQLPFCCLVCCCPFFSRLASFFFNLAPFLLLSCIRSFVLLVSLGYIAIQNSQKIQESTIDDRKLQKKKTIHSRRNAYTQRMTCF